MFPRFSPLILAPQGLADFPDFLHFQGNHISFPVAADYHEGPFHLDPENFLNEADGGGRVVKADDAGTETFGHDPAAGFEAVCQALEEETLEIADLRERVDHHGHFRDDAQGPFRTDKEIEKVRAGSMAGNRQGTQISPVGNTPSMATTLSSAFPYLVERVPDPRAAK